jgi:hypothetical protein
MDVQALRLEGGEAVGDRQELLAHGGQVFQALLQPEIRQIVGADLIAQEGGEVLVLLHEGVFEIGAEDVMPVLDLVDGVEPAQIHRAALPLGKLRPQQQRPVVQALADHLAGEPLGSRLQRRDILDGQERIVVLAEADFVPGATTRSDTHG